jgi:hypothetical protein
MNKEVYTIKDDHGGKIILSKEDINKVIKSIDELDSLPRTSLDSKG